MALKERSWTFDGVFKGTENQESLWTGAGLDPELCCHDVPLFGTRLLLAAQPSLLKLLLGL